MVSGIRLKMNWTEFIDYDLIQAFGCLSKFRQNVTSHCSRNLVAFGESAPTGKTKPFRSNADTTPASTVAAISNVSFSTHQESNRCFSKFQEPSIVGSAAPSRGGALGGIQSQCLVALFVVTEFAYNIPMVFEDRLWRTLRYIKVSYVVL